MTSLILVGSGDGSNYNSATIKSKLTVYHDARFHKRKIKSISEEIRVIWNYKKWSNNFIHDGNLKQNIIDNFLVFYAVGPMGRPRLEDCSKSGNWPTLSLNARFELAE